MDLKLYSLLSCFVTAQIILGEESVAGARIQCPGHPSCRFQRRTGFPSQHDAGQRFAVRAPRDSLAISDLEAVLTLEVHKIEEELDLKKPVQEPYGSTDKVEYATPDKESNGGTDYGDTDKSEHKKPVQEPYQSYGNTNQLKQKKPAKESHGERKEVKQKQPSQEYYGGATNKKPAKEYNGERKEVKHKKQGQESNGYPTKYNWYWSPTPGGYYPPRHPMYNYYRPMYNYMRPDYHRRY